MKTTKQILEERTGHPWYEANSSNIDCYTYEESTRTLFIVFKKNKANTQYVYGYKVPKSEFDSLHQAESKGKWVNSNLVKKEVPYEKYLLD